MIKINNETDSFRLEIDTKHFYIDILPRQKRLIFKRK